VYEPDTIVVLGKGLRLLSTLVGVVAVAAAAVVVVVVVVGAVVVLFLFNIR
jgi:hypothetical protein